MAHVVYALVARKGRDRVPFYVGETARPRKRLETHLKVAWDGLEDVSERGRQLRHLIASGGFLEMDILEAAPHRVAAYAREAGWARALTRAGYKLTNTWAEHAPQSQAGKVPLSRLGGLSVWEAADLRIAFRIGCKAGCSGAREEVEIQASHLIARLRGNPMLSSIAGAVTCEGCGGISSLEPVIGLDLEVVMTIVEPGEHRVTRFLEGLG